MVKVLSRMGFSDITSVNQTLKDINTREDDPLAVFDEDFMDESTDFSSFEEFIEESSWDLEDGEFPITLTVEDFNEYVVDNTDFECWEAMLELAHDRYWDKANRDRRQYPRYECTQTARIKQGTKELEGQVKDISKKGLCLQTPKSLKESMLAEVKLKIEQGDRLEVSGVVRWTRENSDDYLSGLEFTNIE